MNGTTKFEVAIPTVDGKGIAEIVLIEVPCKIDPVTGEEFLTGEALEAIDRVKARHMGLLQPEEIRQLRECLGLTQKGMSELLQIGAKSYTRWESGRERPLRSLNILLRALSDGKLDLNYLRSIQSARFDWKPMMVRMTESKNAVPSRTGASGGNDTRCGRRRVPVDDVATS